jgi:hypothetical protein
MKAPLVGGRWQLQIGALPRREQHGECAACSGSGPASSIAAANDDLEQLGWQQLPSVQLQQRHAVAQQAARQGNTRQHHWREARLMQASLVAKQ